MKQIFYVTCFGCGQHEVGPFDHVPTEPDEELCDHCVRRATLLTAQMIASTRMLARRLELPS